MQILPFAFSEMARERTSGVSGLPRKASRTAGVGRARLCRAVTLSQETGLRLNEVSPCHPKLPHCFQRSASAMAGKGREGPDTSGPAAARTECAPATQDCRTVGAGQESSRLR